jgi:FixJ family two-component response regulator
MQCETLLAVVDDDEDVRAALTRLIGSAGFAVESFASGGAFLRSVEDHKPACVVLDLHMPGMNGLDVQARSVPRMQGCRWWSSPGTTRRIHGHGRHSWAQRPICASP